MNWRMREKRKMARQEKNLWTPRKWKTSGQQERNARDNYQFSFPRLRVVPQGHAEGFTWWWFKSLLASHEFDGVRKEKERLTAAQLLHHESFFWSSSSFSWFAASFTGSVSNFLVFMMQDARTQAEARAPAKKIETSSSPRLKNAGRDLTAGSSFSF